MQLEPVAIAALGFAGGCFSQIAAVFTKDFYERQSLKIKSKQLLRVLIVEQERAIRALLSIEAFVADDDLTEFESKMINHLSETVFLQNISLSDPVNPIILAETMDMFQYIHRIAIYGERNNKELGVLQFDRGDLLLLKERIDRSVAINCKTRRMKSALDDLPDIAVPAEEIGKVRSALSERLVFVAYQADLKDAA